MDKNTAKNTNLTAPIYLRPVAEIGFADLEELRSLQEGWFVEFKERPPEPSKLARSISSFANSHGGLLVIGAKEDQKTRRLADFVPMTREGADLCITKVREAITSHVSPPAYYEVSAIELESIKKSEEERWIVLISIPKGKIGPYLHSSGCIYVRIGDSASPFALSDLSHHERLWADALHRKERIKERVEDISKQFQVGTPSIHLVILADDLPSADKRRLTFEDFSRIARESHVDSATGLFDHVQTLDTSFLARRTEKNFRSDGVMWDYDYQRRLHFIKVPIATHIWSNGEFNVHQNLFGIDSLAARLSNVKIDGDLMVTNLLPSAYFLSIIIHKVKKVHELEGYSGDLQLNARAVDVRGTIPFLATPNYFDEIDKIGLPFVLREIGFIRALDDPAAWLKFGASIDRIDVNGKFDIELGITFLTFSLIAQSMGISRYLSLGIRSSDDDSIDIEPLSNLFAEAHSSSFSLTTQHNPDARGKN